MHLIIESNFKQNDQEYWRPCLCAQKSSCYEKCAFNNNSTIEYRQELRKFASKYCQLCKASGMIYMLENPKSKKITISHRNAKVFFKLLGISYQSIGELNLTKAKQMLQQAKNKSLKKFIIPEKKKLTGWKTIDISKRMTVKLKYLKSFQVGLPKEKLEEYLIRFEELIQEAKELGGTNIIWYQK